MVLPNYIKKNLNFDYFKYKVIIHKKKCILYSILNFNKKNSYYSLKLIKDFFLYEKVFNFFNRKIT